MDNKNGLRADILEIFSSIQGEGPFIGIKQIFIKFAKCNLKCKFCDFESAFPQKEFSVDKLLSIIKQICENYGIHHSVSLTGGEPLLYKDFLKCLLPKIKDMGLKVYLETNGTLPEHLKGIVGLIDVIAMDFKLPSSTGDRAYWKEHEEFLNLIRRKNCFIKAVITNRTTNADLKKTIDIMQKIDKDILLVLQPVWPVKGVERPTNRQLFDSLFFAEKKLNNVRIMPQIHKVLGIR